MITESEIYWITRLDDIKCIFVVMSIAFGAVTATLCIICGAYSAEQGELSVKGLLATLCVAAISLFSLLGCALTPTTKEMAMIKVIPRIANSKFVAEELPADARQIYDLDKKALVERLKGEKTK